MSVSSLYIDPNGPGGGRYADDVSSLAVGRASKPAPARTDPCADPAPPCPACGGLKCLCRPRFFPGQLLSDDDLNRLQQYVIDKNRLHNRYLVGWGVACGLEVACNPCDHGGVIVRAGYALSPCGDDIVVCGDQAVDLCQLIQRCRPANPTVCDPPYGQPPADCRDTLERWVLAVCYDERPARGVAALTGAGDRIASPGCRCGGSAGCGCGGESGGGCSCGGAATPGGCSCGKGMSYKPANTRRKALPQCEPTQICEGYRFTAYPAPPPRRGLSLPTDPNNSTATPSGDLLIAWLYANRARFGPLLERVLCCILRAMDLRAALAEGRPVTGLNAVGSYRDYAQALQQFAADFSLHHCGFVSVAREQFDSAVEWSRTRLRTELNTADRAELVNRYTALDKTWMQIATECLCSALLPACPPSAYSNCVPLAVVTVQSNAKGCRVIDICNWEERKLLITWPTILYWLSWLPWQNLREWIARICCAPDRQNTAYILMMVMLGVAMAGARSAPAPAPGTAASASADRAAAAGPTGGPERATAAGFESAMQSPNLLLHMLGEFEQARTGAESQPMWAALAARLFDGSALAPLAGNAALRQVDVDDVGKRLGVDALRAQMTTLQETVQRQDEILRALQIVTGPRRGG